MVLPVTEENLLQAAAVHAESWRDSHRSFCSPEFVAAHTPQRQAAYLRGELMQGKQLWMLAEAQPVGLVSLWGSLIENLYVLPSEQGKGYGSTLLRFAMAHCAGTPVLWVLSNNLRAQSLYQRHGFRMTGREHPLSGTLAELEMAWTGGELPPVHSGSPQRRERGPSE